MATAYTQRIIGVARASVVGKANAAAKMVDTQGGEKTFTVPLRSPTDLLNTPLAYWCGWSLTPTELTNLQTNLRAQGIKTAEANLLATTATVSLTAAFYLFDNRTGQWTPDSILTRLGLDRLRVVLSG